MPDRSHLLHWKCADRTQQMFSLSGKAIDFRHCVGALSLKMRTVDLNLRENCSNE